MDDMGEALMFPIPSLHLWLTEETLDLLYGEAR